MYTTPHAQRLGLPAPLIWPAALALGLAWSTAHAATTAATAKPQPLLAAAQVNPLSPACQRLLQSNPAPAISTKARNAAAAANPASTAANQPSANSPGPKVSATTANAAPSTATPTPAAAAEAANAELFACIEQAYRGPRGNWPAPQIDPGVRWQELAPRAAPAATPVPLAALGEQLFFDRRLSQQQDISCASCHMPNLGFGDGRRFALGHQGAVGPRHTPHLLGVGHVPQLMWDGRAADLETQALMPISNPIEMAMDLPQLLVRLQRETEYPSRFATAFGDEAITLQRLGQALAAYERRIEAPRTRFDAFIEGQPEALNASELRGLHWFRTQARCLNCHSGPQMTQHEFHQIGISFLGRKQQDLGRQVITQKREDMGAMRTPTLRGISRTGPYFHHGLTPNLQGVLELYNGGMLKPPAAAPGEPEWPQPSPLIQPLKLSTQQLRDLEAFLRTL